MKANHELMVCLTRIVVSRAVERSRAPNEMILFDKGVRVANSIIIIIVIDVCINVVRLFRTF